MWDSDQRQKIQLLSHRKIKKTILKKWNFNGQERPDKNFDGQISKWNGQLPICLPPGCVTDVKHSSCTLLTIWMCHLHSCNSIRLSPIHSLDIRQCTPCTFANWRISTELSPMYPLYFRQLADVHWTFASIPSGFSPIIGESLIGEEREPR
jgi:hypothetical protein